MQHPLCPPRGRPRADDAAFSKTVWTPSLVNDEHSTYAVALIVLAKLSPSIDVIIVVFVRLSSSWKAGSFLRSDLVPTRIIGIFGQKCFTSGTHLSTTFQRLSRLARLKQTSTTSVSGYDRGLEFHKNRTIDYNLKY